MSIDIIYIYSEQPVTFGASALFPSSWSSKPRESGSRTCAARCIRKLKQPHHLRARSVRGRLGKTRLLEVAAKGARGQPAVRVEAARGPRALGHGAAASAQPVVESGDGEVRHLYIINLTHKLEYNVNLIYIYIVKSGDG